MQGVIGCPGRLRQPVCHMLTRAQVAAMLGRSVATVRRMEQCGLLFGLPDENGVHRFDKAQVEDLVYEVDEGFVDIPLGFAMAPAIDPAIERECRRLESSLVHADRECESLRRELNRAQAQRDFASARADRLRGVLLRLGATAFGRVIEADERGGTPKGGP